MNGKKKRVFYSVERQVSGGWVPVESFFYRFSAIDLYRHMRDSGSHPPLRVVHIPTGKVHAEVGRAKGSTKGIVSATFEGTRTKGGDDFYKTSLSKFSRTKKRGSLDSFLVDEDPGCPCVYAIRCKANGGVYIGKAIHVSSRASQHLSKLGRNRHDNPMLQADWNRFGPSSFYMEVIETCASGKEAFTKESKAIAEFSARSSSRLYNIAGNESLRKQ